MSATRICCDHACEQGRSCPNRMANRITSRHPLRDLIAGALACYALAFVGKLLIGVFA